MMMMMMMDSGRSLMMMMMNSVTGGKRSETAAEDPRSDWRCRKTSGEAGIEDLRLVIEDLKLGI